MFLSIYLSIYIYIDIDREIERERDKDIYIYILIYLLIFIYFLCIYLYTLLGGSPRTLRGGANRILRLRSGLPRPLEAESLRGSDD